MNISSAAGLVGFPGLGIYTASKHAVLGLTKSAALEAAKSGIRLNAICPGAIQTEMMQRFAKVNPQMVEQMREIYPIGRFGQPEEIEAAVVWLCSDRAFFVTGQSLAIDGGYVIQ